MDVIFVARRAIVAGFTCRMTGLAQLFLYSAEVGRKTLPIAVLVALQVCVVFLDCMAGEATAIVHRAEMRLMDEACEAALLARERCWREIDCATFAWQIVNAVALAARSLRILVGERIEHGCGRSGIPHWRIGSRQ